MTSNGATVLVVDDDAACRSLVATLLSEAGYAVREAESGNAARQAARSDRPGLVVLDVKLPDVSGYEVCREFRDEFGETLPILFLSGAKTDALDRVGGLLLGADDYVVKPFEPNELVARVRRLASRSGLRPKRQSKSRLAQALTKREREVLYLLAEGKTQKDIARELFISQKTVGTHLQHILSKLGVHSRAEAVAFVHREGVVLLD
jgi:DNA-binding NarL/FixJ family response regulator